MIMETVDTAAKKRKVEQLYEKYQKLMYVVAYHILNHHQDAVLESWEKIIRHMDKIDHIDSPKTKSFLVIPVERTSIDHYRKNKKRYDSQVMLEEYENSPYFVTKDDSIDSSEINQLLRNIPKTYIDVLLLHYVHGFSGKEVADILGIKENTVMKRLSRGRKILRKELYENN